MRKRISARVICLMVAVVVLAGALTVSAINGSPYENLKNAAINALFYENVTQEFEVILRIDGEVTERAWTKRQLDHETLLSMNIADSSLIREIDEELRPFVEEALRNVHYTSPELNISGTTLTMDGNIWYRVNHRSSGRTWLSGLTMADGHQSNAIGYTIFGTAGRNSNQLRLAELVIDLVVGDLKNNLTMSSVGDIRRISGAINESQLPEIARVLIDMAVEEQLRFANTNRTREEFNHPLEIPITGVSVGRISMTADIDSEGNLLYANAIGTAVLENIFGDIMNVEVEMIFRFSDIGTTVPDSLFPGAAEIFTEEFFIERFGNSWTTAHFTLDRNGNINLDSITDQWPSNTVRLQNLTEEQIRGLIMLLSQDR